MSDRKSKIAEASKLLQEGIESIFEGDNFKKYLYFIARLPKYSYKNLILISKQCPIATRLHTFKGWYKYGQHVKSDEMAIRIRSPFIKGKEITEEDSDEIGFRWINLFDISQTESIISQLEGEPYSTITPIVLTPSPFKTDLLNGTVENFDDLFNAIKRVSHYSIDRCVIKKKGTRGLCLFESQSIQISNELSQLHTIKTAIHEMAHSYLHGISGGISRDQKEIEAESIAFVVCNYFDLDTSEYSFKYVASYGVNQEKNDICHFLDRIQKTSSLFIDFIEGALEGQKFGYEENTELSILINATRVQRYYDEGWLVYLIYPNEGECFVSDKKEIKKHDGPFAIEREMWQQNILQAA